MNTNRHTESVEVILKDQRRRRWSPAEKAALVKRTYEPGMSVSLVARQEGVAVKLQRMLGKKTLKNEILKDAVGYFGRQKVGCALALVAQGRPVTTSGSRGSSSTMPN